MKYFILFLFGFLFLGCSEQNQRESKAPNIIYILADDLGYGEIGAYGQEKIQTPKTL